VVVLSTIRFAAYFDFIMFEYGAMFEVADVNENGISRCECVSFFFLSFRYCYSRDTLKGLF